MHRERPSLILPLKALRPGAREVIATVLIVAITSMTAIAAGRQLGEAGSALIFVAGITLAGAVGGLAAGLIAALIAFLLNNFYLAEPVLTLRLATGSDVAPLVVFNLCALIAGLLAGRLKDRAQAAARSNAHLASLLGISGALQSAVRHRDIAAALSDAGIRIGTQLRLYRVRQGVLEPLGGLAAVPRLDALAEQAWAAAETPITDGAITAYRLPGATSPIGVMIVDAEEGRAAEPSYLAALGNLAALAIERAALSEQVAENRAAARTEELKTALLSSVSHDFRTPLATISASASSLIDYRAQLGEETKAKLLRGIVEECDRLNRFTANLLEMGRLEGGQPPTRLQPLDVADLIATVLQRLRSRAGARRFVRETGEGGAVVMADAALFELVLINVLDNAVRYSADGSEIRIGVDADGDRCRITIADEGLGIPDDALGRVFDRFYRVPRAEPVPAGSGLGLAIARGFVEALGGTIEARTPGIGDRGTRILIGLPLADGSA